MDFDNIKNQAQKGVEQTSKNVQEQAPVVGEKIVEGTKDAGEKVGDVAKDVGDKAGEIGKDVKDKVDEATKNLNPLQQVNKWFDDWMGRAKWAFWIILVLAILGMLGFIFKWVKSFFVKDKKKKIDNSELQKEVRKENTIEIVKESPLVKSEYVKENHEIIEEPKEEQEKEMVKKGLESDYRSVAESKKAQKDAEIWDETLNDAWKKGEKKEEKSTNTQSKSFVEELKEKAQAEAVKPSDFKKKKEEPKKRGRKKKTE